MKNKPEIDERETSSPRASSVRLTERGRRRLTTVIVLSIVGLLLLLLLVAQSGFNLSPVVAPDTATDTLLLYALSSLNFLAFVTVLFVLLRNVLKLFRERRAGRLGSKFKSRLVSYAIGLSLLPALLLFFFAFGLLNRSIDRWFGEPARHASHKPQPVLQVVDLGGISQPLPVQLRELQQYPGQCLYETAVQVVFAERRN